MKEKFKKRICLLAIFFSLSAVAQETYPCPTNGNAESNNFVNWQTYNSTAEDPQDLGAFTSGFSNQAFGVHNSSTTYPLTGVPMLVNGVDQNGNFPVPSEGTYCFSVGNNAAGAGAQAMKYTFTVTNANKIFKMRYALVLEDPGHPSGENPAAWFYFIKGGTSGVSPSLSSFPIFGSTIKSFVADLSDPFYDNNGVVVYRDWECLEFDLSAYVGQTVSFVAMARDCPRSGHFGYMYIDGLCTEWPATAVASLKKDIYCLEEPIIMNGSLSEGEESYFVEVLEIDQWYNPISGGLVLNDWFVAQQAPSNFNISSFLAVNGKELECGKMYKIKLAVSNKCSVWNETNNFIEIVCPEVDAGLDIEVCCVGEGLVQDYQLGQAPIEGNSYSWTSIPSGFTANTSTISVVDGQNIAYILEMTQPDGCIGRDTVVFRITPNDYALSLTKEYNLCDYAPFVTATLNSNNCQASSEFADNFGQTDSGNISWYYSPAGSTSTNLIGTGETIQAPNADGILTCKYVNVECNFSITETIPLYYRPGGPGLIAPNSFTPDNGQFNNVFRILEFGPNAPINIGDGPAYGISDFRLRIWNRWGDNFKTVTKADAGRASNENPMQGDIFWDGTGANGLIMQDGVYVYTLEVKYCGQDFFQRVCMDGSETDVCVRWFWIFCIERIAGCSKTVTLIR